MSNQGNGAPRPTQQQGGAGPQKTKRILTFRLSVPAFLAALTVLILGLTWIFILGVIIGRGQNPEEKVPGLASLVSRPATLEQAAPAPSAAQKGAPAAPPRASAPAEKTAPYTDQPKAEHPNNEIIRTEDLQYRDQLKGKPAATAKPAQATPPAKPKETPPPAKEAQAAKTVASSEQPKTPSKPEPAAPKTPPKEIFDYEYQVAAFKEESQAANMNGKLRASGLKTRVEKENVNNKPWFKVVVSFKGSPEDTRILRTQLAAHGINQVIMRQKTPAKQ